MNPFYSSSQAWSQNGIECEDLPMRVLSSLGSWAAHLTCKRTHSKRAKQCDLLRVFLLRIQYLLIQKKRLTLPCMWFFYTLSMTLVCFTKIILTTQWSKWWCYDRFTSEKTVALKIQGHTQLLWSGIWTWVGMTSEYSSYTMLYLTMQVRELRERIWPVSEWP